MMDSVNYKLARERFGFEMRTASAEERSADMRKILAEVPVLHDIARGGDIPMVTDLMVHALDDTLAHVLGHVLRLDDGVSSRAVTMLAFMEMVRVLSEQFDMINAQMMPLVAYHVDQCVASPPPEQAKDIQGRAMEHTKESLASLVGALLGGGRGKR